MTDQASGTCETHLSRLFFTPDRVFKLLKPVALPFVDFSQTATRVAAATEEFARNRALAPDVYLGLADVVEDGGVADRMIVMRRLDADQELSRMLASGPQPDALRAVARHIAALHAGRESLTGDAAEPASPEAVAANWENNFTAIADHVGTVIEPDEFESVRLLARRYLAGRAPLLRQRIADGWVRDGHGDLRAEHIYCTPDGPRVIDCVAFDDRLRVADSLADVAFLAMDLDRLAGPEAAVELMRAWYEFTNEHHPSSLAHFYVAYRAHVRCKIACLRHAAGDPTAAASARTYHRLARRHLEHARIRLVLVGGGPGSGKSTVAEHVADRLGAAWLRSDEVRKDVAGLGHDEHAFADHDAGIYSPEVSARTLDELERQTQALLGQGMSVVLDATWRCGADRDRVRSLASRAAADVTELRCVLPASVAKERIARRMASIHNPSDASPELVDHIAAGFDDWPEAVPIDTAGTVEAMLAEARRALGADPDAPPERPVVSTRFVVDLGRLRDAVLLEYGLVNST